MNRAYNLYQLQIVDTNIDRAKARISEIDRIIKDNSELIQARDIFEEKQRVLNTSKKNLQKAEQIVHSQRIKIEQTEATLYGGSVKNPKELKSLHDELEALKRYLSILEDRQIDEMIAFEEAQESQQQAKKNYENKQVEKEKQNLALEDERKQLLNNIETQSNQRKRITEKISADDLALYEKLRSKKHGTAVARVIDKACDACGTTLTAALYQAAKSPSKLERCPTCKRILYCSS